MVTRYIYIYAFVCIYMAAATDTKTRERDVQRKLKLLHAPGVGYMLVARSFEETLNPKP